MDRDAISVREMCEGDLPAVCGLAEQLGYPVSLDVLLQRFGALNKSTNHKLFVASSDTKVIGWVHVGREMSSLLSDMGADIGALVVDSEYRSAGVGGALMAAAEKWAWGQNIDVVRVRSNVKRSDAHRFYERQGYLLVKSWHLFRKSSR